MAVHRSLLQITASADLCSLQQTTTLYRWQSTVHYYRSLLQQISALYSRPPHSTDGSPPFTITDHCFSRSLLSTADHHTLPMAVHRSLLQITASADLCSLQQTTTLYRWQSTVHYYRSLLQQISALYSRPPHSTDGSPPFTITDHCFSRSLLSAADHHILSMAVHRSLLQITASADLCSLQQATTLYRWQSTVHYYRSLLQQISALYSRPLLTIDSTPLSISSDLCTVQQIPSSTINRSSLQQISASSSDLSLLQHAKVALVYSLNL
ncbi:UNVERIFIED_CONTAM: hypothetical protein FKN15_068768 [Acipenser sinensis]